MPCVRVPRNIGGTRVSGLALTFAAALAVAGCGGATPTGTANPGTGSIPTASSPNGNRGTATVKVHYCTPKTPATASDPCWKNATGTTMATVMTGSMPTGFSATFQAAWDSKNLYVLQVVKDPQGFNPSNANTTTPWTSDAMEVYLSGDNGSDTAMASNDVQIDIPIGQPSSVWVTNGQSSTGVQGAANKTSTGWAAQLTIPWSDIPGANAGVGQIIGIDPAADTYSDGSSQNQAIAWGNPGSSEQNPSIWGQLVLEK